MTTNDALPLYLRLTQAPRSRGPDWDRDAVGEIEKALGDSGDRHFLEARGVAELVAGTFSGSPYLAGLIRRDPARLLRILSTAPEAHIEFLVEGLREAMRTESDPKAAMSCLRGFKNEAALLIALADLGGVWPIMRVTQALTRVADVAVAESVRFQFSLARQKGDWLAGDDDQPEAGSGYFVLAMGKHGAGELNYSSDIDLIVFYEREKARLREGLELQQFFVKLTQQMYRFMNEQTPEGYVFRTDLRLRPDPGATQVAMSTDSALHYYESFGQNWERAAMIKARAIAGDIPQGDAFLAELSPFIWRKYLDYAAIADIHAMKRQIHAHRGFGKIAVAGHNIKLGRGGIREIEFFAQTQQLIAGGRQPDIRTRATLDTLDRLVSRGWVEPSIRDDLDKAYRFLRWLEHRLQMVADEQTQTLPKDDETLARFAGFCGYSDVAAFASDVRGFLEIVAEHYAALFEDTPQLSAETSNLVFAGEEDDPDTITTLEQLGYTRPSQAIATVRAWHRGRHPAVRSEKARERLTNVQPILIEALADTIDPDAALVGFDRFLSQLPAGIQLFALLQANPELMRLVAAIVGSAPRLARILSRRRRVIDAVLDPGIMGAVPSEGEVAALVAQELAETHSFEEALDRARVVGGEQMFLIGARLLTGIVSAEKAGGAYALLAEEVIRQLQGAVEADFARQYGTVPGGAAAVVAMGKLGGREMTAASDLDLIIVYDADPAATGSDGKRQLATSQYYARFTQRLISALSAPTAEGLLYDVDMRLRPSGQKGPIATQLSGFIDYQTTQAWIWEHMALTRARVVSGPKELRSAIEAAIHKTLRQKREPEEVAAAVREMRERIAKEKGTVNIWDLKQVPGGLVDIEFTTQYLQLIHAHNHPNVVDQNTAAALDKLRDAELIPREAVGRLLNALRLINNLTQILRLCSDESFVPEKAPNGLKELLARVGNAPSFEVLEEELRDALRESHAIFAEVIGPNPSVA
jgi:[glutamine synthetase] adenylyltransferase / [glutamine synthetase]-adenylyl-L-tyrosine phosphorylase